MNRLEHVTQTRFPRSATYDPVWQLDGAFGGNPLWLAEWLCEDLDLQAGMKVLDLGCGRAKSSIFLSKEFGVDVWAVDLWIDATENSARVQAAGQSDQITCLNAEAMNLPFAFGFFDAVLAFDSIQYFGTDTLFLPYIIQFLKPQGFLGFASASVIREVRHPVPDHLQQLWRSDFWCLRTAEWWHDHWSRTGLVDVQFVESMPDGWRYWLDWGKAVGFKDWYLESLEEDAGQTLTKIRALARRAENSPNLQYDLRTAKWQD